MGVAVADGVRLMLEDLEVAIVWMTTQLIVILNKNV